MRAARAASYAFCLHALYTLKCAAHLPLSVMFSSMHFRLAAFSSAQAPSESFACRAAGWFCMLRSGVSVTAEEGGGGLKVAPILCRSLKVTVGNPAPVRARGAARARRHALCRVEPFRSRNCRRRNGGAGTQVPGPEFLDWEIPQPRNFMTPRGFRAPSYYRQIGRMNKRPERARQASACARRGGSTTCSAWADKRAWSTSSASCEHAASLRSRMNIARMSAQSASTQAAKTNPGAPHQPHRGRVLDARQHLTAAV